MDLLFTVLECIRGPPAESGAEAELKRKSCGLSTSYRRPEDVAEEVIHIIMTTEKRGSALQSRIQGTVDTEGWTEGIAKAILDKLRQIIENGQSDMGAVLQEIINFTSQIVEDFFQFARDHPVAITIFCTLIALGVLFLIAPWIIEALGFSASGPIEGSFAAWWQSTYRGYVSRKSLFAFFQRLGMPNQTGKYRL
ncbi:hypothetical protein BGW36DRAFT_397476 [Talaromyces proteolyticus]|uniref:Uncharacterized protein n=1 Tax=Talaromyces proteolyticus TaxID=1131652 RepID=A0AAD4PYL1_9EURO|nr:uncharacterized protein BGW36DRAFT_397476 [Talaromyces proteolyticus]KAH8697844.1 hypothetical protein BGW36DRAFT_397476 [Talaromyces proteolyticus]